MSYNMDRSDSAFTEETDLAQFLEMQSDLNCKKMAGKSIISINTHW